ncbi:hypothetical protein, partial [Motiliproteus sp. MSK22-1]|uniref:hypothetical protein n=1 Tax=Motiliproteus sp. MSK22-1 TaxID=1897630 RepID=UPI001E3FE88A
FITCPKQRSCSRKFTVPVHGQFVIQNLGYLSMPTSLGLMYEAFQSNLHCWDAVAAAIRTSGL